MDQVRVDLHQERLLDKVSTFILEINQLTVMAAVLLVNIRNEGTVYAFVCKWLAPNKCWVKLPPP
jgi:hypothetical protein